MIINSPQILNGKEQAILEKKKRRKGVLGVDSGGEHRPLREPTQCPTPPWPSGSLPSPERERDRIENGIQSNCEGVRKKVSIHSFIEVEEQERTMDIKWPYVNGKHPSLFV